MTHFPHGAFVAIHAAQEQQRRDREEEEEMTRYSVEELDSNWEFKIVRSESGAFRKPEVFQMLLQEESIAGWELVEKIDDRRVRFKRTRDAHRRDATLPQGYDPYRSVYGRPAGNSAGMVFLAFIIAIVIGLALLASVLTSSSPGSSGSSPIFTSIPLIGVAIMVILLVLIAVFAIKRRG